MEFGLEERGKKKEKERVSFFFFFFFFFFFSLLSFSPLSSLSFSLPSSLLFLSYLGLRRPRHRVHQRVPVNVQAFPHDQRLHGAHLEARERVRDAEDELARVLRDLVEELGDQALLLDELDVGERGSRELDGLVEAVLAAFLGGRLGFFLFQGGDV